MSTDFSALLLLLFRNPFSLFRAVVQSSICTCSRHLAFVFQSLVKTNPCLCFVRLQNSFLFFPFTPQHSGGCCFVCFFLNYILAFRFECLQISGALFTYFACMLLVLDRKAFFLCKHHQNPFFLIYLSHCILSYCLILSSPPFPDILQD